MTELTGINDYYSPHKIVSATWENNSRIISDKFDGFVTLPLQNCHFSLTSFSIIRPLTYVDNETIERILDFFNSNADDTLSAIDYFSAQISNSVFSLLRENPSWSHEEPLSIDTPERIIEFDSIWHPEYQRYSEHVLNHLIQIPLFILGKAKAKDYNSPTLSNRVELLRNNSLSFFCNGFIPIIRNSIAHGTVYYQQVQIHYVDKKDDIYFSQFEFSATFDQLVTTCNSIVSAILLFICQNWKRVLSFGLDKLPLGLRFLLIDGITAHDGFFPVSMLSQLTFSVKGKSIWFR